MKYSNGGPKMAPTDYRVNEKLILGGQYIQLQAEVPLSSGILNLYDAYSAGYAIDVIAAKEIDLGQIKERFFSADEDAPIRLKGTDHRAMLDDIFAMHLKPAA